MVREIVTMRSGSKVGVRTSKLLVCNTAKDSRHLMDWTLENESNRECPFWLKRTAARYKIANPDNKKDL